MGDFSERYQEIYNISGSKEDTITGYKDDGEFNDDDFLVEIKLDTKIGVVVTPLED